MHKSRRIGINRRAVVLAFASVVGSAGVVVHAQAQKPYPIFTLEHFVSAMKTTGQAFAAVNASLARNEGEDAKAFLAISRERLATTITFWRDRKRDDAVAMLRDGLAKMDELDVALSAETIDPTEVGARAKRVAAACGACHAIYREQDPATRTYRLKSGSAP